MYRQIVSIVLIIIGFLAFPLTVNGEQGPHIEVVLSRDSAAYREVSQNLRLRLGGSASQMPDLSVSALPEERASYELALDSADLVITVGTGAAVAAHEANPSTPILAILIPQNAFEAIFGPHREHDDAGGTTAIYLDQPYDRQLALARRLVPKAERVGALFGPASHSRRRQLEAAVAGTKLALKTASVGRGDNAAEAMKEVIDGSDLVLAVPDSVALTPSRAKWLLYMSYRRKVPVIGFSAAYTKAGALAAVYSTPSQIGRQAAERALEILNSDGGRLPPPSYPQYFSVAINDSVAYSLRIAVEGEKDLQRKIASREGTNG